MAERPSLLHPPREVGQVPRFARRPQLIDRPSLAAVRTERPAFVGDELKSIDHPARVNGDLGNALVGVKVKLTDLVAVVVRAVEQMCTRAVLDQHACRAAAAARV